MQSKSLVIFVFIFSIVSMSPLGLPQDVFGIDQPNASKGRLSPEERAKKKQAREAAEDAASMKRRQSFGIIPEEDKSTLANEYRDAFDAFRKSTAEFLDTQVRLQFPIEGKDLTPLHEKWIVDRKKAFEHLVKWRNKAAEIYVTDPQKYYNVGLALKEMLIADSDSDRFDRWTYAANALLEAGNLVDENVLVATGYVGLAESDFDLVRKSWGKLNDAGKLEGFEQAYLVSLPEIERKWDAEVQKIAAGASKNNPTVEITTTKGIFVVELFEDEAPQAVASFIYLVESYYYVRKPFFRVLKHRTAQTGCEKGDGRGNAGYSFAGEAKRPGSHTHFRGSLAVALGADPVTGKADINSGGAQFYISQLPTIDLDPDYTVFGRVIDGIEVLGMFKACDMTNEEQRKDESIRPDTIVRARVLNKRNHEYRPTPNSGKLLR